jgi:hypothetical protein
MVSVVQYKEESSHMQAVLDERKDSLIIFMQ